MGSSQARALSWVIVGAVGLSPMLTLYTALLIGRILRRNRGRGLNVPVQTSTEPLTELIQPATPQAGQSVAGSM